MHQFHNILLVHTATNEARQPLERAIGLAQKNNAQLTAALSVKDPSTPAGETEELRDQLNARISAAGADDIEIRTIALVGTPFLEIIRQVLREGHDLVIIGAEQENSLKSLFLGSTAFHLLRKCPCPVWVTRDEDKSSYARILAALDPDPDNPAAPEFNQSILGLATSFAVWDEAELDIAHAWDVDRHDQATLESGISDEMRQELLDKAKGRAKKRMEPILNRYNFSGLKPRMQLPRGEPGTAISELVEKEDIDLIVMGTVCRTGIPGFFIGNTAEFLLHAVDCAILAVKPEDFVTPVTLEQSVL